MTLTVTWAIIASFFSQWITLLVCCQRDLSMQREKIHQVNFNEIWNWLERSWMYQKYTYLLWIDCKHWTFIFFECNHREHLSTEAVTFQNVEMKSKCVPTKKMYSLFNTLIWNWITGATFNAQKSAGMNIWIFYMKFIVVTGFVRLDT